MNAIYGGVGIFLDGMPWYTPLDVVFMSNCGEKYCLITNVCSYKMRTRLQYELGDGAMEDDRAKIIKRIAELMESKSESEIELFIKELEKLVKTFT